MLMFARRILAPLLALAFATGACAQGDPLRAPPVDAMSMKMSFSPIVRHAAPAVVNVFSRRVVRQQVDPFWGAFAGGVPRERVEQSLGSGSIVRADGVVLTNHHVIDGATEVMVVTADRREWPATVLLDDARADLAVLKIDPKGEALPSLVIDTSDAPQVGDLVLAIGDPFGVGQTVTNGIVSALARSDVGISDYSFFIQTDAAINPGNSGGPLVDMAGNLIGVNTAILSRSGSSSGVGFAIPAAMARQVVEAAIGGGHAVTRPWLGAKTQSLTSEMARSLGLAAPQGVVITDVWPDGPAARAGIAQGDVVVSVDAEPVNDEAGINYRVATRKLGESLSLVVRRNGGPARDVRVTVEAPPSQPAPDARTLAGANPFAGATVINVSPAAAYQYGVDPFAGAGVVVAKVEGGYAQRIGLRAGDFILQINGRKISSTADMAGSLQSGDHAWTVVIQRAGQTITAQFQG